MFGDQINIKPKEASNRASVPQLVKFNRAFKLAEQWVNEMSNLDGDDKSAKVKIEGRPPRLGVGAAIPREPQVVRSNDPVERRLRDKLETEKTKVAKNAEIPAFKDGISHEDSDDEDVESKAKVFVKKRPVDWTSSLQAKKKHK